MAKLTFTKLRDIYQTGSQMERIVRTYNSDMSDFDTKSIFRVFRYIAKLPYLKDKNNVEILHRPKYLRSSNVLYRDCDDKMIMMGSYLYRIGVPFKFVAVSNHPSGKIHHVLIMAKFKNGSRKIIDPTYSHNKIFQHKPITNRKYISNWIEKIN